MDVRLTDLGQAERIDCDGRLEPELLTADKFSVTYWCYQKDYNGLWVKAPRVHLIVPVSTLSTESYFRRALALQPRADQGVILRN